MSEARLPAAAAEGIGDHSHLALKALELSGLALEGSKCLRRIESHGGEGRSCLGVGQAGTLDTGIEVAGDAEGQRARVPCPHGRGRARNARHIPEPAGRRLRKFSVIRIGDLGRPPRWTHA